MWYVEFGGTPGLDDTVICETDATLLLSCYLFINNGNQCVCSHLHFPHT